MGGSSSEDKIYNKKEIKKSHARSACRLNQIRKDKYGASTKQAAAWTTTTRANQSHIENVVIKKQKSTFIHSIEV